MKKRTNLIAIYIITTFFSLISLPSAFATHITFPFSTTFLNCPEQTLTSSSAVIPCEGWFPETYQTYGPTPAGSYSQITANANFPNGGGGLGWRLWNAPAYYQVNANSPGINFLFSDSGTGDPTQYWVRFYIRFQPGYAFSGGGLSGQKMPYLSKPPSSPLAFMAMAQDGIEYSNGVFAFYNINPNVGWNHYWNSTGVSEVSDGQWICVEQYYKGESTVGAGDSAASVWMNGTLVLNTATVPLNATTFHGFGLPVNGSVTSQPGTTNDLWEDIDDIAMSTTGRVGCPYAIGGGGTKIPSAPTGLTIQ